MKMSEAMKVVSEWQGCSVETLREALKKNAVPYGTAFQQTGNERYTYLLYPVKVKEYLGLDLGDKPFCSN